MSKKINTIDYQFASDNCATIDNKIMEGLSDQSSPCCPYGGDESFENAGIAISKYLDMACKCYFVSSGTAANSLALSHLSRPTDAIICHEKAHVNTEERGAPHFYGCGKFITIGSEDGKISAKKLEEILAPEEYSLHHSKPAVLTITQPTELGTIYLPSEIEQITSIAKKYGIRVHMDGARFANALDWLKSKKIISSPSEILRGVDILCLGGTKNGIAATEAIVLFDDGSTLGISIIAIIIILILLLILIQ